MTETLTHTKRRDWKVCHRYFYLRHEKRLELRAKSPGRRRGAAFGKAIFAVGAAVQAGNIGPELADVAGVVDASVLDSYSEAYSRVASQSDQWELDIEVAKVQVMAEQYIATYGIDRRREVTFDFPLRNPLTGRAMRAFRRGGKIDGLVTYEGKVADLIEDKFTSQITKLMIERLPLDEQILEYADALAEVGWQAIVLYRHTRFPGINPEKAKEFKTKEDRPAETIAEFKARLRLDVLDRHEFYFDQQRLVLDASVLEDYRQERWATAQDILATRAKARKFGVSAFYKSTTRCLDFGGCQFLPICEQLPDAMDRYEVVPDNQELIEEEEPDGEE